MAATRVSLPDESSVAVMHTFEVFGPSAPRRRELTDNSTVRQRVRNEAGVLATVCVRKASVL